MRALVVIHPAEIRKLVALLLETHEFQVYTASEAPQALRAFGQVHPTIVLLDPALPETDGVDGWELLRLIRQETQAPIVLLSATDDALSQERGRSMGADDYVTMPFYPYDLARRVLALVANQ